MIAPARLVHVLCLCALAAASACRGSDIDLGVLPAPAADTVQADTKLTVDVTAPSCVADIDCAPLQTAPCALALCEPASRRCVVVPRPDFAACDSGDPCAGEATCGGGACIVRRPLVCDDGNPCTLDSCKAGQGCRATPKTQAICSDGNPCTTGDHCQAGACVAKQNLCSCTQDSDCAGFSAGDACLGALRCVDSKCVPDPSAKPACDDGNPCTDDVCAPQTGACFHALAADGKDCDDANLCTTGESCQAGTCVAASSVTCTAPGGCASVCEPLAGCTGQSGGACDDGNACTANDGCLAGTCVGAPTCGCKSDAECAAAGPVPACQGKAVCLLGVCAVDANQAVACSAPTGEPCVAPVCVPGQGCLAVPQPAGTGCDDGTACTGADVCDASGSCVSGAKLQCDDGNPCTVDFCTISNGCAHGPGGTDGKPCDDGNPCTTDDVCLTLACQAGLSKCDDQDPCTLDLCDPANQNACLHVNLGPGSPCEDGDPCTEAATCEAGACVAGLQQNCADGNPCTDDACTGGGACSHLPTAGAKACDDGDACSGADKCAKGKCQGEPGLCQCQKTADCKGFEDGNLCNGTLVCNANACVVDAGTVKVCGASGNACVSVACQPATGQCVQQSLGADTVVPCSDGNACTTGDTCKPGGFCSGGAALTCNDGDACTLDGCTATLGCTFQVGQGLPCDDGNLCTFGDTCAVGGCKPGSNACECQKASDCTVFDDGNLCNGGLVCKAGVCVNDGKAVTCATGASACSQTACDPQSGGCVTFALVDGTLCGTAKTCSSGGQCQSGTCVGAAVGVCDDGNPCTQDACGANGCSFVAQQGLTCTDGNPCTQGEVCGTTGTCGGGSNTCTCQVSSDCPDDGDLCNGTLECAGGTCQAKAGSVVVCDAALNVACQANVCAAKTGQCGLQPVADLSPCNDGSACTQGEACAAGACKGGQTLGCDDGKPCTVDACDPKSGCTSTDGTGACNDGNPCTLQDVCKAGGCQGLANGCDDGNACTTDACDPKTGGCVGLPGGVTACDDGDPCTSGDACAAGVCSAAAVVCDDGNDCTADSCDATGTCASLPSSGTCTDGNPCTADACQPGTGTCQGKPAAGGSCDDGKLCTTGDLCGVAGTCSGAPVVCNDGDACTQDTCDSQTGLCGTVPAKGFSAAFDDDTTGGLTFQSLVNSQVKWQLDTTQAVSKPGSLYVGVISGVTGIHSYQSGPAGTTATLPPVQIPAGVKNPRITLDLYFDRDPQEPPGCAGFADAVTVLVNNQPKSQTCTNTKGFVPIVVDLAGQAGQEVTVAIAFVSNFTMNNGQGAWVDNVVVTWDCL